MSKGTEDPSVYRLDGRGPAGSQPVFYCKVSVVDPKRIVGDVRDDYGLATEGGSPAGTNSRPNHGAVDGIVVARGSLGAAPCKRCLPVLSRISTEAIISISDRSFCGAQQIIQDARKWSAGRNLGKHAPFRLDLLCAAVVPRACAP